MSTRVFEVPAISCGHCKETIEGVVGALDDVDTVTVDVDARTVTVDGAADDDRVVAALDEAGYDVAGRSTT